MANFTPRCHLSSVRAVWFSGKSALKGSDPGEMLSQCLPSPLSFDLSASLLYTALLVDLPLGYLLSTAGLQDLQSGKRSFFSILQKCPPALSHSPPRPIGFCWQNRAICTFSTHVPVGNMVGSGGSWIERLPFSQMTDHLFSCPSLP